IVHTPITSSAHGSSEWASMKALIASNTQVPLGHRSEREYAQPGDHAAAIMEMSGTDPGSPRRGPVEVWPDPDCGRDGRGVRVLAHPLQEGPLMSWLVTGGAGYIGAHVVR